MYLHQHSWHSCSRTQGLRGVATTAHGSCHLEAGRGRGGGEGEGEEKRGRGRGGKGEEMQRKKRGRNGE